MARFARYLREEKYITTYDAAGVRRRWEYGRRLLMDRKTTHPNGRLLHGVTDTLVANATASGYKLSEREIQYRLRCGRTYETEAKLRKILAEFDNWWQLIKAGFPPVEGADEDAPHDPRDADEKLRDAKNTVKEHDRDRARADQLKLDLIFLPGITVDTYPPESTLEDLWKAHEYIKNEVTPQLWADAQRSAREDLEREGILRRLIAAVRGNRTATWEEASRALRNE